MDGGCLLPLELRIGRAGRGNIRVPSRPRQRLQHTIRHFAEEEKLMQETNFPGYTGHKEEHDSVLADMVTRIGHWKQHGDFAAQRNWLDMAVGGWPVADIASMDTVSARFAAAKLGR